MRPGDYYKNSLMAQRLQKAYDCAPPRVKRYLNAEIEFVAGHTRSTDYLLELGCGYGRVIEKLAERAAFAVGIDISSDSIRLAAESSTESSNTHYCLMDAGALGFKKETFDLVVCIQNGISAIKIAPEVLISESISVLKKNGRAFFSSYLDKFWPYRIEWFEIQAELGLIGPIEWEKCIDGVIICKDGFRAVTFSSDRFAEIAAKLKLDFRITEVEESAVFCEYRMRK